MGQIPLAAKILPFRPAPAPYPPLDYLIPQSLASLARPGARALVSVKGKGMEGLILRLFPSEESEFENLKPVKSIFPSPGMDEEGIREAEAVSEFFGGHLANVLDLAIPERVQYVEKEPLAPEEWTPLNEAALKRLLADARLSYRRIPDLEGAVSGFEKRSFVWDLAQGQGRVFKDLALLALLSKKFGYSFLACIPSANLFGRLGEEFEACGLSPYFAGSARGRAENYRAFLACCAGGRQVLGTRKVMHFPVKGPCALVDVNAFGSESTDGMAPYANVRSALSVRHEARGGIRVSMSYCHGVAQEKWLRDGEALQIFPSRAPHIYPSCFTSSDVLDMGDRFLHLPSFLVGRLRKNGAEGKKSLLVCPAGSDSLFFLCPSCGAFVKCSCGAAVKSAGGAPSCRRCKRRGGEWKCQRCGRDLPSDSLVPLQRGPARVKSDLKSLLKGEALSNAEVAVAGALPQKPYSLVAILDAWLSFYSLHLDAEDRVLNSWMEASSLASEEVILIGECQKELLSSFAKWNCDFPKWELEARRGRGMPPFRIAVNIWGKKDDLGKAVEGVLEKIRCPSSKVEKLGPMPTGRPEEELCSILAPLPPPLKGSGAGGRRAFRAAREGEGPFLDRSLLLRLQIVDN